MGTVYAVGADRTRLGEGNWAGLGILGFSGSRLFGFSASRLRGFAAFRLRGFSASRFFGFAASRLRGFAASRLRGFAASRLFGFSASRLRGFAALRLCGFAALRLCGFAASRLRGFAASRLFGFAALRLRGHPVFVFPSLATAPGVTRSRPRRTLERALRGIRRGRLRAALQEVEMQMGHERLDVYKVALEVGQWTIASKWPRGTSALKHQAVRSAASVVLNIAEGYRRRGKAQAYHYEIARGSAAETLAVLQLVGLPGGEAQQDKLRRIDRMLERMGG